jgi:hypothetical protein
MTTVYVICIRPVVDRGAARRERDRAFRRRPFSTRRNVLAILISQRLTFRALPLHRLGLVGGVILPAQVAPLVSSTRQPMTRSLLELAAILVAIVLPSVMMPAEVEARQASPATQLEDDEIAHP